MRDKYIYFLLSAGADMILKQILTNYMAINPDKDKTSRCTTVKLVE